MDVPPISEILTAGLLGGCPSDEWVPYEENCYFPARYPLRVLAQLGVRRRAVCRPRGRPSPPYTATQRTSSCTAS